MNFYKFRVSPIHIHTRKGLIHAHTHTHTKGLYSIFFFSLPFFLKILISAIYTCFLTYLNTLISRKPNKKESCINGGEEGEEGRGKFYYMLLFFFPLVNPLFSFFFTLS